MTRVALLCPGRGSYTERTLRSLPEEHELVERAEELRRGYGLESLRALDGAARFDPARHLAPANASALIYVVSMLDAAAVAREHAIACVAGNSLGWYTALAAAGALSFDDGFRLVQEMAILQQEGAREGGQVIYPRVGDDWRVDEARASAIDAAVAAAPGEAFRSIELGGYAVLAGTEAGIAHLMRALPRVALGKNSYPFRLLQHGPYHTPLLERVAERARTQLADIRFRPPERTLVDGTGRRWSPWASDPRALAAYTLGAQVVTAYDFSASVRVALREHAPELLVLPGPGNTLGGVCGQVLVAEGWRGIGSRADFDRVQASERPIVRSMRG